MFTGDCQDHNNDNDDDELYVCDKNMKMTNGTITNLAYHDDDATGHDFNDHDAYLRDSLSFYINQGDMVENQC